MHTSVMDRIERFLARRARAVSILAVAWFWLGVGIQARFVPLPDLPPALSSAIFWGGVVANGLWWGVARPALETRRAARLAARESARPSR